MRLSLLGSGLVKAVAVRAVERGFLSHDAAWDCASRWSKGLATSVWDVFDGFLTTEQVAQIVHDVQTSRPEGDFDSWDEPPAAATKTSLPPPSSGGIDESRYELLEEIGTGGIGRVLRALDRGIGRVVALKTLKEGAEHQVGAEERFLAEAKITAELEHPNVVPIYDIGTLPNGKPYYTMRVVKRQSLQDVLASEELRKQWPLVRLIGAFVQISRALAYAHRRGILHRDIKPENILLGDFGEVYLADWGNAKVAAFGDTSAESIEPGPKPRASGPEPSGLSGTPGYIAPEQIRGDRARVDHRADLFALGVVLYEILTGEHPFEAPSLLGVILATQTRAPKSPRVLLPGCPLLLEDLCLALLQKDPSDRPESADRVAAEAEAFLEGARERSRRLEEARRLSDLAKLPVQRSQALKRERDELLGEARRLLQGVRGCDPVEKKRAAWQLEDKASSVERDQAAAFAEAVDLYTKALAYDPELIEARASLADLYWSRAIEAEEERRPALQVYYETLVSEFDVGRYGALLRADAVLSVDTNMPGAVVIAQRWVEHDRVLVPSEQRYLGRTPLREARLAPGSYLLTLKRPGYRDVRYPVLLLRGQHHFADVNLYTDQEIGEDFLYVPGGPFVAGGDPLAPESLVRDEHYVEDFAIARFPVTYGEYCAFLDAANDDDPSVAQRRTPRERHGADFVVRKNGRWEPADDIIEGEACKLFPADQGHLWNVPVSFIDWFDAVAFCRYAFKKASKEESRGAEGTEHRLPTELEWEKAARGTDGRIHPWGDHFDPTFCLMRSSRPFLNQTEPIGTFPVDTSPYGVRDMAGGVREWVSDIAGERTADECLTDSEGAEEGTGNIRVVRSASWQATPEQCRAATRSRTFARTRTAGLGFRVAHSLRGRSDIDIK